MVTDADCYWLGCRTVLYTLIGFDLIYAFIFNESLERFVSHHVDMFSQLTKCVLAQ